MLKGKKILIGVTGGIAAYKTANIVRLLVKDGAEVRVIMTASCKGIHYTSYPLNLIKKPCSF